jgi:hypothetical protein
MAPRRELSMRASAHSVAARSADSQTSNDVVSDRDPDLVHVTGSEVTLGISVTLAEIRLHAPRGALGAVDGRELEELRQCLVVSEWCRGRTSSAAQSISGT